MPTKLIKIISISLLILVSQVSLAVPKKTVLDLQHFSTPTGTRVFFVPVKELPMIDIKVAFSAGSARDGLQSCWSRSPKVHPLW